MRCNHCNKMQRSTVCCSGLSCALTRSVAPRQELHSAATGCCAVELSAVATDCAVVQHCCIVALSAVATDWQQWWLRSQSHERAVATRDRSPGHRRRPWHAVPTEGRPGAAAHRGLPAPPAARHVAVLYVARRVPRGLLHVIAARNPLRSIRSGRGSAGARRTLRRAAENAAHSKQRARLSVRGCVPAACVCLQWTARLSCHGYPAADSACACSGATCASGRHANARVLAAARRRNATSGSYGARSPLCTRGPRLVSQARRGQHGAMQEVQEAATANGRHLRRLQVRWVRVCVRSDLAAKVRPVLPPQPSCSRSCAHQRLTDLARVGSFIPLT